MREIVRFPVEAALPGAGEVLASQGMPGRPALPEKIAALLDEALQIFAHLAEPRGIMSDISREDFAAVYRGEGLNAEEAPLPTIAERADALALFAATLGEPVSAKIGALFRADEPALGFMLDAVASLGADKLADLMGRRFLKILGADERGSAPATVLPYSPGYCGWHITAQRKLFEFLRPGEIGITLNPSCLMQPLKSVSGVLVAGKGEIHRFRPKFSFCADCKTHECVERMASARGGGRRPAAMGENPWTSSS